MTTFHLSITLDPATVHSGDDVQRALALTGAELANKYDGLHLPDHLTGIIRDANGNAVGTWSTGTPPVILTESIALAAAEDYSAEGSTSEQSVGRWAREFVERAQNGEFA
ncbi:MULTISPECIES: hypothetical protein [unclassified Microbacterium]|uniref:hypothetical protein n=1 Tax=unclassified Microbacterium TaxID=2609290 RepID=UPI000EA84D2E|nr:MULTISPECIES: hypothetical protein [unclassified Microbacterium]MBT2484795.1 hypothetical protein [Microbacterium sp. ISL-108]RKN67670.1 hypothetical protein D7252_08785 [Microbacterium sp. CGR2]